MRRRAAVGDLRRRLVDDAEQFAATYGHIDPGLYDRARLIASGEEITLHGWQISEWAPGVDPSGTYCLTASDVLREIETA